MSAAAQTVQMLVNGPRSLGTTDLHICAELSQSNLDKMAVGYLGNVSSATWWRQGQGSRTGRKLPSV